MSSIDQSLPVTPAAMAAYKKVASGSTSDRDIETAMVGVPKDTDDPALMASFLRGSAKLQRYDAAVNNARSEWLGAVKHLGKAKEDIEIDGVRVPAGTTFKNFADAYVEQKIAKQSADRNAKTVQGRSYMRYAQPQQPAQAPAGRGERQEFDVELDLVGTEFQRTVWAALQTIPYGETRSYGEIAAQIGTPGASRAVGLANGHNPISIIVPCHRVIGANGSLTGYGGGLDRKKLLLGMEKQYAPAGATLFD